MAAGASRNSQIIEKLPRVGECEASSAVSNDFEFTINENLRNIFD